MGNIIDNAYVVMAFIVTTITISAVCKYAGGRDNTDIHLAQCLRSECDECADPNERAAIAWILRKQASRTGRTLDEQILAYCAMYKSMSPRAVSIWASTFNEPKYGDRKWWTATRKWVSSFLSGHVPDPHPNSCHWGGLMDTTHMAEIARYWHGKSANVIYACGRKRK